VPIEVIVTMEGARAAMEVSLTRRWMCRAGAAPCTKVRSIAGSWRRRRVPGHAGVSAAAGEGGGVRSCAQVAFVRQAGAVGGKESLSV